MIHTFGDSHSRFPWEKIDNVNVNWIGAKLMHTFASGELVDFGTYNKLSDGDYVIFSFGEIDCRCHVIKYITSDKTYKDVINDIAQRFEAAIQSKSSTYRAKNITTCINMIPPPAKSSESQNNPSYPFLGTDAQRKDYVLYLNKLLAAICDKNGWLFIDTYEESTDSDGFLSKEIKDNSVHISDPIYIKKFINKWGMK